MRLMLMRMLMMMSLLIQWKCRRWYSFWYWWRCWWWGWWWKFRFGPFSILSTAGAAQMPGNNNMQRLNYAAYITLYNLHRGSTENLCKTNIFQSHCRFFHVFHVFHPVMFRCEAQHFSLAQWLRNEMSTAKLSSCEVLGLREARHVGLLRLIAICCSLLFVAMVPKEFGKQL